MKKRKHEELKKFAESIVNVSLVSFVCGVGFLIASIFVRNHILQGCVEDECGENLSRLKIFSFYGDIIGITEAIYGIWFGKREGLRKMVLGSLICLLGCLASFSALLFCVTLPERSTYYPFLRPFGF